MTDIAVIGSHFRSCRHQEFILRAILPAAGGGRAGPQTRARWRAGGGACMAVDRKLLAARPALGRYYWETVITLER